MTTLPTFTNFNVCCRLFFMQIEIAYYIFFSDQSTYCYNNIYFRRIVLSIISNRSCLKTRMNDNRKK